MMNFPGIQPADILLPKKGTDLSKWSVIACDQFTSSPEYWERVEAYVGDAPSTLRLIQPEAFPDRGDENSVPETMKRYAADGTLTKAVNKGFLLTERTTASGARKGLLAALDLENYDYTTGSLLTRATEGTVAERLPVRIRIREKAILELPHVMVLIDDPEKTVIEPLFEEENELLYDFDLMEGGGHLRGWKIDSEKELLGISRALNTLLSVSGGFLYAVGDGNHSLAAAKAYWEELKSTLPEEQRERHPARYALCELVNLHSEALKFAPIHRVIFGADSAKLEKALRTYLAERSMKLVPGNELVLLCGEEEKGYAVEGRNGVLPVAVLQNFLDAFVAETGCRIDYIHGEEDTRMISRGSDNTGILLQAIAKDTFFEAIRKGGHFPRKTFSMGEAREKRYYLECRMIQ